MLEHEAPFLLLTILLPQCDLTILGSILHGISRLFLGRSFVFHVDIWASALAHILAPTVFALDISSANQYFSVIVLHCTALLSTFDNSYRKESKRDCFVILSEHRLLYFITLDSIFCTNGADGYGHWDTRHEHDHWRSRGL